MFKKIMKSFVIAGVAHTLVLGMSFPAQSRNALPNQNPRTTIKKEIIPKRGVLPDPIPRTAIKRGVLPDPIPRPAR